MMILADLIDALYRQFASIREQLPRPVASAWKAMACLNLILGPVVAVTVSWDVGVAVFFISAAGLALWTGYGRERFQTEELSQEAERIAAAKRWYVEHGDAPDAEDELERKLERALEGDGIRLNPELAGDGLVFAHSSEAVIPAHTDTVPSDGDGTVTIHDGTGDREADDASESPGGSFIDRETDGVTAAELNELMDRADVTETTDDA